jgi:crotonobetainyl-CoA:carnitine CoA-transferase CaiB-like acyl-CoA transferase
MSYPLYYSFDGATPPARSGADHATIFPYGAFRTGDGGTVMLGLQNEREWRLLCERVLEQPELADDERFSSNSKRSDARVELRRLIEARFADLGTDAVIDKLLSAGIASARMNTMHDVWAHPQLRQRERFTDVPTPAGPLPALLPPGVPSFMRARMDAVPALGEHTLAIMRELGYSAGEIDELKKNGTITCS